MIEKTQQISEFETWLYAFLIMAVFSTTVLVAHLFGFPLLNFTFEICVFYVPTALLLIIVLHRKKSRYLNQ
jgi:hypothetical protein